MIDMIKRNLHRLPSRKLEFIAQAVAYDVVERQSKMCPECETTTMALNNDYDMECVSCHKKILLGDEESKPTTTVRLDDDQMEELMRTLTNAVWLK